MNDPGIRLLSDKKLKKQLNRPDNPWKDTGIFSYGDAHITGRYWKDIDCYLFSTKDFIEFTKKLMSQLKENENEIRY